MGPLALQLCHRDQTTQKEPATETGSLLTSHVQNQLVSMALTFNIHWGPSPLHHLWACAAHSPILIFHSCNQKEASVLSFPIRSHRKRFQDASKEQKKAEGTEIRKTLDTAWGDPPRSRIPILIFDWTYWIFTWIYMLIYIWMLILCQTSWIKVPSADKWIRKYNR